MKAQERAAMNLERNLTPSSLRHRVEVSMTIDAAHDWRHVERVFANGMRIARTEPAADPIVLRATLLLHDLGEKRTGSGNEMVTESVIQRILEPVGVPAALVPSIVTAINEHSFTRGVAPGTLESAIVQDADRLDAMGAIGIARAFAVGGARGRPLYAPDDPANSLQHFYDKLLRLRDGMNTAEGRRLAQARHAYMEEFVARFLAEWAGEA